MRVSIYYNLHKHCLSMVAMEGPNKGRVIDHPASVVLTDVKFVVQEGGRQRVLREKRKNVHAFVRGNLLASLPSTMFQIVPGYLPATYNPYRYATFVDRQSEQPVLRSDAAIVNGKSIYYLEDHI